jgi:ABC-type antimicrobial peptide transport system permease subunit
LEVQGVSPSTLRSQLRLRAVALTVAGTAGGVVVGLVLAASTVALVALAAGATSPEPPLVLDPGWGELGLALLAFTVASTLAVALVTAGAFRERSPRRPSGSAP